MKKILSLLLVITMIIAICPIPTKAATTGTLYCDFTEITTDAGLSAGTEYMFLTTHYTSSDAVTTIGAGNAKLRVTGTANSGGTKLTGDGYTMGRYVEVVTAGTGFDGCPNGAITYTKGAWYYWCSGGGVHHVGPFYAFSYTQKSFSASDINVTVNYNTLNTTDTVDKSDLNIQVAGYNVSDYTITDGSISPSDRQITLNVGGVSFTATLGKVVTFTSDANSTGTTTTKVVLPDSKGISVPSSDGTYSGHTFQGWAATSGSSVVSYAPGAIYNIDESATFYAVWKADTYDIAYDANGGSSAPESQTKTYNVGLALSSTVPVRDGYTFINWNAVKGGGGTSYASGATYTANSALTLYAQWTAETYSVSYNANGGSGAPAAQTKTYGSELTLSGTTPTCSGYIFVGWSKDASAKSADYSAGGSYTANEGVTLYAVWQSAADTVSYNANGGSDAPAAQTKIPNVDLTLSSTVPTRTGYTFLGWATSPNGPVAYSAGGLYPAEDSVVFYAVWLANTYEVKYDDNLPGGKATTVPDSQAKTHDVSLTLSGVVPTFEGYTFTGWATASNGAVAYAPGSVYTGNAGVTLYAVWADSKYNTSTVLTTVPSANVFDGDSVTLTATVSRVGQGTVHPSDGTVTFFEGSTVLGTTLVGTDGAATFNITAVVGSHTYSAVYNGNDEAYRSTNGDNACTLSVKSIVVILGYSELAVSPDIDLNGDVLAVGTTYVLTAPTVFASDDKDKTTALSVNTHYTVQWYWYNGSSWCEVNSDTGNPTRLTVTPSANGQKWYAKILPAGKYQQPSSGLSTVQVTCGTLINTATTLASTPTSAYENAANAVTLTATVKYGTSSPVNDGWVMFMNENDVQVGYAKLDNQGHASVTVTLPAYSSGDHIANYYAVYEGTSAYDISKSKTTPTSVNVKSTSFAVPVVTVSTNSTTIGSTTTNAGLSGLTAGTSYTLTADASSVKGIDGESVSSGDYTFYWQKVSGGNTVTVATGNTYSFTAVNGDAYRLLVEARNNMKVGASSHLVSVNALSTVTVTLDTSYTFLGGSDASTQNVSTNRINGSHVGDAITLTASVTGTTTLPTGTVDFYYISNSTTVKLARVSLAEWDTNVATASYTLSGTRLGEGVYTFYAVYNGSTTYTSTSYNSQNGGSNDPSVKPYRVWSVTINDCTLSTNPTVSNAKLTAGSTYTFVMGAVYTTDGELLDLGTDYDINWYVSTNGSATGYGSPAFTSTGSSDNTWTQTPANNSYLYKAVVKPLYGSESAKYPALGVTSNTFSTDTGVTTTSLSNNTNGIYEGNNITFTAPVTPTGNSVPTGTVEFYYYTTNPASPVLIDSASVTTRTTASGTVYYAAITTDDLPSNAGVAQDVYVYATYTGNGACKASSSSATPLSVKVKSSTVDSASVLIITSNGSFSPSFSTGMLPADGSKSSLTLGTVITKDGGMEPLNETDFVITWERSTNYSGDASKATWTTIKTGEYSAEVAPSTKTTAYRAKITPKFAEKTVKSGSAYYSNIISSGTASSVTQMSFVSSDSPAVSGTDLIVNIKVFGGGGAPTGTVTLSKDGSNVDTKEIVNGITSFSVADLLPGKYTLSATYTSTNGYSASTEERVFYVRYAPSIELADQTYTYNGQAHTYNTNGVTMTGLSSSLNSVAKASVSFYYKDSDGNVTVPVDAGTYKVYAYLPETQEYASAVATGTLIIEPRTLVVTDFITQAKTFDGSTSVTVMTVDTDAIHGDSIVMGGTAVLDSANAGSRNVTYTPSISGSDVANYKLASGYTVTKSESVARSQLAGSITSGGVITLYKANSTTMSMGTATNQYSVEYYYHSGAGVKAVTSTSADGKYTVIARPNDMANYKGGLSTTMTVTNGVKSYAAVTCNIPVSFAISNTTQAWDGKDKSVTVTPSISGFTGYSVTYNNSVSTDTSKVGVYGITVAVTADGYTGSAVGRMQVVLGEETKKASIDIGDKAYDGECVVPTITNTPAGNYYIAYTGGNIKGVSYMPPKDAGTYVATLFVESTDRVVAYNSSDIFTISKKTVSITADDKAREQYATDPVWTYTVSGLVSTDSSADFIMQPSIAVESKGSNDNFDQVGTYTINIGNAYATNYDFTYTKGTLSVNSVDPNAPMTIVGLPNGAIRYGDSYRLYTYGTKGIMVSDGSTVGYSDSSVISYSVVSGNASINGDVLTITGTGAIVLKVTRGEGQNAIYATISSINAIPASVEITPTFGTNTYDSATAYNATGATITGTVSGGVSLGFGGVDTKTTSKINAGSYVMVVSVKSDNAYYSGTGAGLMLISPATATVTADNKTSTYGTAPTPTSQVTSGSMAASPLGYSEATATMDVGTYKIFAAGVNYSKNYVVSFVTGTQTVGKKALTITTGSLDGTEYGVSATSAIAAASFEISGDRIYGAGNQIMDYAIATLISGDSLADLSIDSNGFIVSYDKDKTSDANRTFPDHTVPVAGLTADYAIAPGTIGAVNYTITANSGVLNIYQRGVTVTAVNGANVSKPYDGTTAAAVAPSKYTINNIANNDLIGLVYTAAFESEKLFDQKGDGVTMTLIGLSGTKKSNYYLQTGSLDLPGRILPVAAGLPTGVGTNTATLNSTLLYTTGATEVGFYIGTIDSASGEMIKIIVDDTTIDGISNPFSVRIDSDTAGIKLAPGQEYKYYPYVKYGEGVEYVGEAVTFRTAKGTSSVTVTVSTSSATDKNVIVSILEGNKELYATTAKANSTSNGKATFAGLKSGVFSIVATCGSWSETRSITIADGTSESISFTVPENTTSGNISTSVTVEDGAPAVAANGLSNQFDTDSPVYTPEDKTAIAGGGSVKLDLNVGSSSGTTVNGTQASVFELSLTKTTTDKTTGQITQVPVTELDNIIEVAVPLTSEQITNRTNIVIYREHNGTPATAMTKLDARQPSPYAIEGYYVDYTLGYVFIYSKQFSNFYIVENTPPPTPVPNIGGGGGGIPTPKITITVTAGTGGSITPETTSVTSGINQTFTISANSGYVISDVIVDDVSVGAVSQYTFENILKNHTISAIFAKTWINPFSDVKKNDWFYEAVKFVSSRGLMDGMTATKFGPDISTDRAMLITVLYRLEGSPTVTTPSSFKDVESGQWYAKAVAWGAAKGIVQGFDDDTFGPNLIVTREQMAAILYRYASFKGCDVTAVAGLGKFMDAGTTSDWALKNVQWAVAEGLLEGTDSTTLAPTASVTRAQMAMILMRFINNFLS